MLTIAPTQNESTTKEKAASGVSRSPSGNASFASPSPIHRPLEASHRPAKKRLTPEAVPTCSTRSSMFPIPTAKTTPAEASANIAYTNACGMTIWLMSQTAMPRRRLTSTNPKKRSGTLAALKYTYVKSAAAVSSIMRRRRGMRPLQFAHRPRKKRYDSNGTNSYQLSVCPHDMQRERPFIDLPVWKREATTSRKLPMMHPSMNAIEAPSCQGMSSMCPSLYHPPTKKSFLAEALFLHNYVLQIMDNRSPQYQ